MILVQTNIPKLTKTTNQIELSKLQEKIYQALILNYTHTGESSHFLAPRGRDEECLKDVT